MRGSSVRDAALEDSKGMFTAARPFRRLGTSAFAAALLGALALLPHAQLPKSQSLLPESSALAMNALKKAQAEAFVENRGQWDAQAQFLARSPGVDTWVTERGVVYDFYRVNRHARVDRDTRQQPAPSAQDSAKRRGHVVRMEFVGGKPSPSKGDGLLEGRYNYFIGNDESKWASNVPRYSEVRSEQVYDGIEARWYFDQERPRYDLIVAPGTDPGKIQMRFEGALGVSGGNSLKLGTSLGDVEHKGLFAYQKVGGATNQVTASFAVRGNVARFEVGAYDRSVPLVIDPLVYSTFLGGDDSDDANTVAVDAGGNAVVAGYTYSTDLPTTTGSYDQTHNGTYDSFVSRLSPDGSSLVYSTFLGGANDDFGSSVALDASGGAIVAGYTRSTGFPTTAGSFDQTLSGYTEAFVSRLTPDGSSLLYSTFLGGNDFDYANSVAVDAGGSVVVVGYTYSTDFPTTAGSYDETYNCYSDDYDTDCGKYDAFVSRLSADGSSLLYSTFLGAYEYDYANSVAIDAGGSVVVAGYTDSYGFPTTIGSYDQTHNGNVDGFVSRLSADGSSLLYSTFLGGAANDFAESVALDSSGDAVVAGGTYSTGFPTTAGSYDETYNGRADAFVSRLSPDGSSLVYSTLLGSAGVERANSVALDSSGGAVVVGYTNSVGFPTTAGSYDQAHNGGADAFVSRMSADGSSLIYSTYLGGTGADIANSVALHSSGGAVVAGLTESTGFPTTTGSYDETYSGSTSDAFVSRLTFLQIESFSASKPSVVGGYALPATVALDRNAPPGGVSFAISADSKKITGPSGVLIKAGTTSTTFNIKTYTVLTITPCTVTATYGGVSKSVSITLKPGGLQSFKASSYSFKGGTTVVGTILLSAPAPSGGRNVDLVSGSGSVQVPARVTVPQGQSSYTFPITSTATTIQLSVQLSAKAGLVKKAINLTLNP